MTANKLKFNQNKIEVLLVDGRFDPGTEISHVLDGVAIPPEGADSWFRDAAGLLDKQVAVVAMAVVASCSPSWSEKILIILFYKNFFLPYGSSTSNYAHGFLTNTPY